MTTAELVPEAEIEEEDVPVERVRIKGMKSGQRIAGVTPAGLRLRVLDAIPQWERWPRALRKMALLFPTHGTDVRELAKVIGLSEESLSKYLNQHRSFDDVRLMYENHGKYPDQMTPRTFKKRKRGEKAKEVVMERGPLQHGDLVAQYANEMTVVALIQSEDSLDKTSAPRIAEKAGWFENIESDTRKRRSIMEAKTEGYIDRAARRESASDIDDEDYLPLPRFDQSLEVSDDFDGVTSASK